MGTSKGHGALGKLGQRLVVLAWGETWKKSVVAFAGVLCLGLVVSCFGGSPSSALPSPPPTQAPRPAITSAPAPITSPTAASPAPSAPAPPGASTIYTPTVYILEEGDTLRYVAAKFGVSVDDLVRVNNLTDPDLLLIGQQIVITGTAAPAAPSQSSAPAIPAPASTGQAAPTTYTVGEGETLGNIAAKFDVTVEAIAKANKIDDPDSVSAGQKLEIPAPAANPAGSAPPAPAVAQADMYTVEPGDTLKAVAARFGLALEALLRANNLEAPDDIEIGQKISIPR